MSRRKLYSCLDVLTCANAVICTYGWKSKKDAFTTGAESTADIVTTILTVNEIAIGAALTKKETVATARKGKESTDKFVASAVIEWILSQDGGSDYMRKLRQLVHKEEIPTYEFPMLVSAINSFKMSHKNRIENEKLYSNNFFGDIKNRYELGVTVLESKIISRVDCESVIIKFLDSERNLFVWFPSNIDQINAFVAGRVYDIRATVKKHEKFNGLRQTILTRVNINKKLSKKAREKKQSSKSTT